MFAVNATTPPGEHVTICVEEPGMRENCDISEVNKDGDAIMNLASS